MRHDPSGTCTRSEGLKAPRPTAWTNGPRNTPARSCTWVDPLRRRAPRCSATGARRRLLLPGVAPGFCRLEDGCLAARPRGLGMLPRGFAPPRPYGHQPLKLARLLVPPRQRWLSLLIPPEGFAPSRPSGHLGLSQARLLFRQSGSVMPPEGFAPPRPCGHCVLSAARLLFRHGGVDTPGRIRTYDLPVRSRVPYLLGHGGVFDSRGSPGNRTLSSRFKAWRPDC